MGLLYRRRRDSTLCRKQSMQDGATALVCTRCWELHSLVLNSGVASWRALGRVSVVWVVCGWVL
jgi:hypothetical protein